MKKIYLSALAVLCLLFAISATIPKPENTDDDDGFKNLKVLPKDISEDALDSLMDNFCVSLGVKCGFCHARNADTTIHRLDCSLDTKDEKEAARSMMQMTQ